MEVTKITKLENSNSSSNEKYERSIPVHLMRDAVTSALPGRVLKAITVTLATGLHR